MTPYVYLIGWKAHDLWYYGVRYAKNCKPEDLWKTYKTSSIYVKRAVEQFGEPDVVQIRKTFKCKKKAMWWEHKAIKRIGAVKSERWLNKTDNLSTWFHDFERNTIPGAIAGAIATRGKTYDEIYGDRADEMRASRSASNSKRKGTTYKKATPEQRENYRKAALKRWSDKQQRLDQSIRIKEWHSSRINTFQNPEDLH